MHICIPRRMIEFDPDKARLNRLKHGIDFTDEEAL
jgi:uncharacterized DUF497 family protein